MSSQTRKFFVLREPFPATDPHDILCRLVVSKASPLDKYAPFNDPSRPAHRTCDIIPSILPNPEISATWSDSFTVAREKGFTVQLSALLNINLSRSVGETIQLESGEVKKYALENPHVYFRQLINNDHYLQDARELIASTRSGYAYLITGFITTTDTTWTIENTVGGGKGFNATVPLGQAIGLPDAGLLDSGFGVNASNSNARSHTRHVAEEQVFAVSYSVVKMTNKMKWLSTTPEPTPMLGRPKRAKAHHLAMNHGDSSDDEEIEWDSEDSEVQVTKRVSDPGFTTEEEWEFYAEGTEHTLEDSADCLCISILGGGISTL
jgi:hypothetical protein